MKENRKLLLALSAILFSAFLLFSSYAFAFSISKNVGNSSAFEIAQNYAPEENLRGWINISLDNEPVDSLISAAYLPSAPASSVSIIDFLVKTGVSHTCSPSDCGTAYSSSGSGELTKSFTLNSGSSKIIGFKVNESSGVPEILNFSMQISSSASASCINPLSIDIIIQNNSETIWTSNKSAGTFTCTIESNKYGSYESSYASSTPAIITSEKFCNVVNLSAFPNIKIGAKLVDGSGNSNFTMTISSLDENQPLEGGCSFAVSSAAEEGCIVNKNAKAAASYEICITKKSGADYKLSYDTHNAVGSWSAETGDRKYDWQIFSQADSYAPIGDVVINRTLLSNIEEAVSDYLSSTYSSSCSAGCIIPIKITSFSNNQQISLSSGLIKYPSGPSKMEEKNFYELSQSTAKVSMPFTKIYINNSGLKAPREAKNYNVSIKIGNELIVKRQITVMNLPVIEGVYPATAPAAIETTFVALVSGANITSYTWKFGDNTTAQNTTADYAVHKYLNIGIYNLTLTAGNANGAVSRNFLINATSPRDYINSTLATQKQKIANIKSKISGFPPLVKSYIEESLNLTNTEMTLASLQTQYNSAGNSSQTYISIANSIPSLNLPDAINVTEKASGKFIINKDSIIPGDLKALTGENSSASDDAVKNAIYAWFIDSLSAEGNLSVYSAVYGNTSSVIASYANIKVTPKSGKSAGTVYAVVSRPKSSVRLSGATASASLSSSAGFSFDLSSGGSKSFEFLIPERMGFLDMPVYFSPSLSELQIIEAVGKCNFNSICEQDLGEDYKNCRTDCKPTTLAFIWIIVVLFVVFCLYIAAQEWYKRYYENYLFKNKNDLYNLVNFIDNAEKQGLKRDEMLAKLKEKGWHNEQMVYAYKKYKGQRTGMWEIPIFKFLEKRKVESELELRKKIGVNPSIPPKPIKPFVPAEKPIVPEQKPLEQKPAQQPNQQTK